MSLPHPDHRIAVIIPAYKVTRHISSVLAKIPAEVWRIYVIDDACPDGSGKQVEAALTDERIRVLYHLRNQGVGGAVMTGYRAALAEGCVIMVKVDGDGQMDPALIHGFVRPILAGEADYTKGNRFFDLEGVRSMPAPRLLGNAILSLMTKLSSGYWNLFDPTNGYTAIHADVARRLPFEKIDHRYFFESDMLFRLNVLRAVVVDIPMEAAYGEEVSNLRIPRIVGKFLRNHVRNFFKRIFYNYYLRDLSLASIELPVGIFLFLFGTAYGGYHWMTSAEIGIPTPAGTVMLAAMPMLLGIQFVMAFLAYDIAAVPKWPQQINFKSWNKGKANGSKADRPGSLVE